MSRKSSINKRTSNAVEIKTSRYVQGGLTTRYPNRLGWWERRILDKDDMDICFTISLNEERRPDIVAYKVYNDAKLAWLVLQYNDIVDINEEFVIGKELRLPSPKRVMLDIMTQSTGGQLYKKQ